MEIHPERKNSQPKYPVLSKAAAAATLAAAALVSCQQQQQQQRTGGVPLQIVVGKY